MINYARKSTIYNNTLSCKGGGYEGLAVYRLAEVGEGVTGT